MKKILFLIAFLFPVFLLAQTFTPDSKNWKHSGYNEYSKYLKIETKTLTGAKIDGYDSTRTKVKNSKYAGLSLVLKADSVNPTTGSYTTRYDFKNEVVNSDQYKFLKLCGTPFKGFAPFPVNFANGVTMTDGRLAMNILYVADTTVMTGAKYYIKTQGSYTADNFNGFILYKVTGSTVTQVAITANTATAWSITSYSTGTIAFTAPYTAYPGVYYLACLSNWSAVTTVPVIDGMVISDFLATSGSTYPLIPYVGTQNTAGASYNISAILGSTSGYYYAMMPY